MCSAAGETSPFVCVLSVPGMGKLEWHHEKVVGLSHTRPAESGFIYFAQNRCGTEDMWRHYFLNVVIPTIVESNKSFSLDGSSIRNFFSTDGEAIILKNAYKNDVLKAFDDANVDYGRVGAGSTGIHNACDRILIFRDTKAAIRIAESKRVDYSNHLLERYLRNAMNNFKSLFPHVSFFLTL